MGRIQIQREGCPKKVKNRTFCGLFSKIIIDFGKSWIKCWEKKTENQVKKYNSNRNVQYTHCFNEKSISSLQSLSLIHI